MNLTYRREGDYLYPDLTQTPESLPLGKYGMLRRKYLMEHRSATYNRMLMEGTLTNHLQETDQAMREQVEQGVQQMQQGMVQAGTMPDKGSDPLGWAAVMNNLKNRAEELALPGLVYSN
ncbi:TnpV protein [Ruminococcaceae bacterium OttesenSCG-928-A11]|nr:TnpV protein [Ruminococcaceae bacterium OttesenSCG-928-A11]